MSIFTLSACGDDDNNEGPSGEVSTGIVGTWVDSESTYDGSILTLGANGSYTETDLIGNTLYKGSYAYNEALGIMTVSARSDNGEIYKPTFLVQTLDAENLVLIYSSGSEVGEIKGYYTRKNASNPGTTFKKLSKDAIRGYWRYDYGDYEYRDYTMYGFFEDGTGVYFTNGEASTSFTYTINSNDGIVSISDRSARYLDIRKITDNSIEINGCKYKKSQVSQNQIILGEWYFKSYYCPTSDSDSDYKETTICFSCEGTYTSSEFGFYGYFDNHDADIYFDYYGSGEYTIWNNSLNIYGNSHLQGKYQVISLDYNEIVIKGGHTGGVISATRID